MKSFLLLSGLVTVIVSGQRYDLTSSCGSTVQTGGSCTLTCNTLTTQSAVSWYDGTQIGYSQERSTCSSTSPSLPDSYTSACPTSTNFTISFNNANYTTDSKHWRCGHAFGSGSDSSEVVIDVIASDLTGSSRFAVQDSSFQFTCTRTGSLTSTTLSFKRGTASACTIAYPGDATQCEQFTAVPGYSCSCGGSGVFYLNISSVKLEDEDTWSCEVNVQRSNSIALPVYYGPYNNLTIDQTSPVTVIEDVTSNSLTVRCSAHCKPDCSYTWWRGSQQVSDSRDLFLGSFRRGQEGNYTCRAENTATGDTVDSQALTVIVHYPPGSSPVISGFSSSPVYEGDIVTLFCRVTGGNPLVTSVNLTCPEGQRSSVTSFEGTNTRLTTLNYTVSRNLRSQPCRCSGVHSTGRYHLTTEITKEDVYYPSQKPSVSVSPSLPWSEGQSTSGVCQSVDTGYPPASYRWYIDDVLVDQSSQLDFHNVSHEDNQKALYCTATNRFTEVKGLSVKSDPLILDVHYRPIIKLSPQGLIRIPAGSDLAVNCSAVSNPGNPTVSWYLGDTLVSQINSLTLTSATKKDSGIYTCHAVTFSIFGNLTSSHLIDIDVFDKPLPPVQFYCTKQTPSSVNLQWMDVNTFKGNTSFVLEQKFEGDREYSNSNLGGFVSDSENKYEKSVDSLKDSSLYYFRLYSQDLSKRSDPVEATCFTSQESSSIGAGIGIGIGIMIVFDVIFIVVVFLLFRKRILGKTTNLNNAKPTNVYENTSFDEVNTDTSFPLSDIEQTQKSEYAELETREQQPPNTYEKIRTYENT